MAIKDIFQIMSLIPLNGYSNKYFSALNQRYGSSILSLGPFQQNAVKDIVRLSYQAGVEDARRAIRNKQKKNKKKYDDDEDDDD